MEPSAGGVEIRQTRADEAAAFRELRLEALRLHPSSFGADYATDAALPPAEWAERLGRNVGNPLQTIYFAAAGDALIGMMGIHRGWSPRLAHSATIWGVYVREGWRGRGVTDRLIGACLDWAGRHETRIVKLAVVATNAAAIRCYGRNGFAVYGVEPLAIHWDGRDYDELLMAARL